MKVVLRLFTLALTITICLSCMDRDTRTIPYSSSEMTPKSKNTNKEPLLELAVPNSAIVRLKQGNSYTGKLTAFNVENLEIVANSFSETVTFSQIKQVEFQGDIWIVISNETRKRVPIRGLSIPLEAVPVNAFKLENPPHKAVLDLGTVLNEEEFERLSSQTNKIYVVKKILFDSSETMTIRIVAVRR